MPDLGSIIVAVLVGATGEYAGAELVNLRRTLSERLRGDAAWEGFAENPDSAIAQQRLIATINRTANADQSFASSLARWTGSGYGPTAIAGSTAISGNVGAGSTIISGGKRIHIGNRTYPLGGVIGGALIALAILAGLTYGGVRVVNGVIGNVVTNSLTAQTTCRDFMASDPGVRDEAVRRIGSERSKRLHTFDRLNVESACGRDPARTLGSAIDATMAEETIGLSSSGAAAPAVTCAWKDVPGGKNVGLPPASVPSFGTGAVDLDTNRGHIVIALDRSKTPCTAASLAFLSGKNFYNGTKCHRVVNVSDFKVIQCGDPTAVGAGYRDTDGQGGPGYLFAEENLPSGTSPTYPRGTVAMAKTAEPATTGSQFFITSADTQLPADYTVLGTVTAGLDIVTAVIAAGDDGAFASTAGGGHPKQELLIRSTAVS